MAQHALANNDGCAAPVFVRSVGQLVVHRTSESLSGFVDGLSRVIQSGNWRSKVVTVEQPCNVSCRIG